MTVWAKLKKWGVTGACDYCLCRLRNLRIGCFFKRNAAAHTKEPQLGITVVGHLSDCGSLNKMLRDFCFALKDAGIPFQTWDLGSHVIPREDVEPILTDRGDFRITKFTHLVEMIQSPVPDGLVKHRARIVFWEFESGLLQGYPVLMERSGDVIAMSDFNYNYYKSVFDGRQSVHKLLYPLRFFDAELLSKEDARRKFGIAQDAFVVFYNFSYKSGIDRKNPEGALRAFAKGVAHKDNSILVFKTASSSEYPQRARCLHELAKTLGVSNKVVFVDEYLTGQDVFNLTNTCDVYISLHRAEGFGLGIAEAMSLGKPVIVTDYSSTKEFCNETNSIPVGYKMVAMEKSENRLYSDAKMWADPDIDVAAAALEKLYNNPHLAEKIGTAAKKSIRDQYSNSRFKESILQFLS